MTDRIVNILSLGAGVQSTVVALMMHRGDLPKPDAAIFADPGEEHPDTYQHLSWLIQETKASFPTLIRSAGSRLGDNLLKRFSESTKQQFVSIPAFTSSVDGGIGIARRQCTSDYKVVVIERAIRHDILLLKPRQRVPKDTKIIQWFGLSAEEGGRIMRVRASVADRGWQARFPLFELLMDRQACQNWLSNYKVPHMVPRSACSFCPYKSNLEWQRLKEENGPAWERAVQVDHGLRIENTIVNRGLNSKLFLHRSCLPIDQVNFQDTQGQSDRLKGQLRMGFADECEGMCGV